MEKIELYLEKAALTNAANEWVDNQPVALAEDVAHNAQIANEHNANERVLPVATPVALVSDARVDAQHIPDLSADIPSRNAARAAVFEELIFETVADRDTVQRLSESRESVLNEIMGDQIRDLSENLDGLEIAGNNMLTTEDRLQGIKQLYEAGETYDPSEPEPIRLEIYSIYDPGRPLSEEQKEELVEKAWDLTEGGKLDNVLDQLTVKYREGIETANDPGAYIDRENRELEATIQAHEAESRESIAPTASEQRGFDIRLDDRSTDGYGR